MLEYNYEIKNYASFNFKTKIYYFNQSKPNPQSPITLNFQLF